MERSVDVGRQKKKTLDIFWQVRGLEVAPQMSFATVCVPREQTNIPPDTSIFTQMLSILLRVRAMTNTRPSETV